MKTKIIRDEKIKAPYKKHPNHELIEKITKQDNVFVSVKKDSAYFKEDYEAWGFELGKDYTNEIEELKEDIKYYPIPPKVYDINWHQLKQFKVTNKKTGEELNAFVAAMRIGKSDHRITYQVIENGYNKNEKTYYLTLKFLNCYGHCAEDMTYSDTSDNYLDKVKMYSYNLRNFSEKHRRFIINNYYKR